MKAYTLNAFAKTSQGGNPARVVFDADAQVRQAARPAAKKRRECNMPE
jgi:predicted PhzF superfamily epimerase YddE/YHI9